VFVQARLVGCCGHVWVGGAPAAAAREWGGGLCDDGGVVKDHWLNMHRVVTWVAWTTTCKACKLCFF